MLSPDNPVLGAAVFGRQVELFLESDVGMYLRQRAQSDIDSAMQVLRNIDAFKPEEILKIQLKLKVAERIVGYLAEAVLAGQQATEHIREDA